MSREAIHNSIRARFKAQVADVESLSTQYDNAPHVPPDNAIWCRWSILTGDTTQQDVGASTQRERTIGVAMAQLFGPVNQGDKGLLELADKIVAAFRRTTAAGVTYRTPSIETVGRDGKYWQVNVACPWYADEFA